MKISSGLFRGTFWGGGGGGGGGEKGGGGKNLLELYNYAGKSKFGT